MQKKIQKILGENLLSLYTYPKYPTETLVIVVEKNAFQSVQEIKEIVEKSPFICLSKDEIENGGDVFSLQFFAIQKTSTLLFGKDIFSELQIEKEDIRRKVEYDIRNKNIYLRQEAIRVSPQKLLPYIIPELLPVLFGISFLHDHFTSDIQKLLRKETFPNIDISPLLALDNKKKYSQQEATHILLSISKMLKQWAEVIDRRL